MSAESLVFHMSRSGAVRVFDPATVPHFDGLAPILEIVAAVIAAGYRGVAVDELRLANGRYCQCLEVDVSTPEGKLLQQLSKCHERGDPMPSVKLVLDALAKVNAADRANQK